MRKPVPVHEAYGSWAASYDSDVNLTRDLDAELLREADLQLDGAFVVEFGAGTGKNTAYLATRASRIIALDFSAGMLERARARIPHGLVQFVEHDITRTWPIADGVADIVVGNLVLEHIADLTPVFSEARRVLRSGGVLYICELHPYRQLRGTAARFDNQSGAFLIEAYVHMTAEYVRAGLAAGFEIATMQEPMDKASDGETIPQSPRLLQITFRTR
ncbi:class I SAM-dependent methyltransferase [Parvibaculum sp.]|uniref:class I SAM-dependent methyltransferase n=1 Tax=Parvibaculum sp. TaxID=2024848 RepID=UPI00321187C4